MPKVQTIGNPLSGKRRAEKRPAIIRVIIFLAIMCGILGVAKVVIGDGPNSVVENTTVATKDVPADAHKSPSLIRGKNVQKMKNLISNVEVKSDKEDEQDDGNEEEEEKDESGAEDEGELPATLTLNTIEGEIIINLRPDLSRESVQYIKALLDSPEPCRACRLYRAEQRGILQGILTKEDVPRGITKLGNCPKGVEVEKGEKCHGPMMTRGMVGWAAGEGGPDFFIDNYHKKADWWGNEHTVWGEVIDESSLEVIVGIFDLPTHKEGLTFLDTPIHIDISE